MRWVAAARPFFAVVSAPALKGCLTVLLASALAGVAPAWAQAASAPSAVPDTIAQRVLACTGCHGKEGRATNVGYFPRIAGKPAGYLFNQLLNFRDGRRQNLLMAQLLEHLTDDYLREIARHFASLDLGYPAPPAASFPADLQARGERLVREGDPGRRIPACAQCHGERLTGVEPAIPGLLGLPRDYINAQLGAWKVGQRIAAAPDCMAQIATALTPEDISAVSAWLSTRAVPGNGKPAADIAGPWPMRCGATGR